VRVNDILCSGEGEIARKREILNEKKNIFIGAVRR
jgi:hypothetical protein